MTSVPSSVVLNVVNKIEVYIEPAGNPEPTGTVPVTVDKGSVMVAVLAEVIVVSCVGGVTTTKDVDVEPSTATAEVVLAEIVATVTMHCVGARMRVTV